MLVSLIVVITLSILASFICSLMEAAIFSVSLPHVKHLADQETRAGKVLLAFKADMGKPIATILIINTIAHTLGASVGGALVSEWGEIGVLLFSIFFTLLVLIVSEIIPKQLGSVYSKEVAVLIALPLSYMSRLLAPLVWVTELFSAKIGHSEGSPSVSHHEVLSMAEIGREEGVIDGLENSVIKNVIGLDQVLVKDILTPRVVVFSLKDSTPVTDLLDSIFDLPHSRIPIFADGDPNKTLGYVTQRDIMRSLLEGPGDKTLKDLMRPIQTVPELMRADSLMLNMVEKKEPVCSVVDEHGGFAGLVTLEDLLEEIIGKEIVDEYDRVRDLRGYAKALHELSGKGGKGEDV